MSFEKLKLVGVKKDHNSTRQRPLFVCLFVDPSSAVSFCFSPLPPPPLGLFKPSQLGRRSQRERERERHTNEKGFCVEIIIFLFRVLSPKARTG